MVKSSQGTGERQHGTGKQRVRGRITPRFTIGFRFVTFVVLVALLAGGVVGFVTIDISRNSLRQEALNNNLIQADLVSEFAASYMKTVQAHIRTFAARQDVRQAVLNDTPEQLQPVLAQFVELQTSLEGASIFDAKGIVVVTRLVSSNQTGQSFADRDFFQQAVATGQPFQGSPVKSRGSGKAITTYAVPIFDEQGLLRGVLGCPINLAILSDAIVRSGFNPDTKASIIDFRNGSIIADADPQRLLTLVSGENQAVRQLLAGEHGSIETTNSSGPIDLIGFAPVRDLPWGVIVSTPSKTALALVNTLTRNAILYTGLTVLFACIAGVVLMLGVTRPLRRLVEETKGIGRGNLDYKVDIAGRDEIGDLSRAFSQMAQDLKQTLVSRDELAKEVVEREHAEESLKQTMAELARSNEELQRFAYVASHDLQEPLRMVASYVQLIERRYSDKLDADAHDFIAFAVDGSKRMQNLINDLLAYSRVDSRAKPFELINMEDVFKAAIDNLQVAIEESKAEITHKSLPTIIADEGQMVQVFQNLLTNAIKFRGKELPQVHISAEQKKGEWIFSVKDNGIGIEPQYFDRLFIIFQRLHGHEYPGTGAGLSITKRIVERHGGRVWVESEPGKGSTFYFSIPISGGKQI